MRWFVAPALVVVSSCEPRARGEALFIVDTDVAPPSLVSALRVDVYAEDGTWIDSREIGRSNPSDWPASFSVYEATEATRTVLVRLRAYPRGTVRDYRGERYTLRAPATPPGDPAPAPAIPKDLGPRLIVNGIDRTPPSEPNPFAAIDRLVRVRLVPGVRGSARLVLHGACFGTMADTQAGASCVDQEYKLTRSIDVALDPDMRIPAARVPLRFGARQPCTTTLRAPHEGLFDDEVCVPGGAFLFGDASAFGLGASSGVPERVAVVSPFVMDRYEVTVGRWRAAVAAGFESVDGSPGTNDGPITGTGPQACAYTTQPMGREGAPVNCVTVRDANAFCAFVGGSLPTEVQWRWVAQAAERPMNTRYPWGDSVPTCGTAVFARSDDSQHNAASCRSLGYGVVPEDETNGDVAIGTGVRALAGNVAEIALDAFYAPTSRCWESQGLLDPRCDDPDAISSSVVGGSWDDNVVSTQSSTRRAATRDTAAGSPLGLRCVRAP